MTMWYYVACKFTVELRSILCLILNGLLWLLCAGVVFAFKLLSNCRIYFDRGLNAVLNCVKFVKAHVPLPASIII